MDAFAEHVFCSNRLVGMSGVSDFRGFCRKEMILHDFTNFVKFHPICCFAITCLFSYHLTCHSLARFAVISRIFAFCVTRSCTILISMITRSIMPQMSFLE